MKYNNNKIKIELVKYMLGQASSIKNYNDAKAAIKQIQ